MQGLSERKYAAHAELSRGAIQKAKTAGRLVLHADGSIDAAASDRKRAAMTDPSKQRGTAKAKLKPVSYGFCVVSRSGRHVDKRGGGLMSGRARTWDVQDWHHRAVNTPPGDYQH